MNHENDEIEIDLGELIGYLLGHIRVILLCTVCGGVIAGLISIFLITPLYQSTAKIYILSNETTISLSDLQMGSSLASDYEELITSRSVVKKVIENLELELSVEELVGHVSVANKENTRIISITVTYPDPQMAQKIANEFAEVSKSQMNKIMKVDEPTDVDIAEVPEGKSSPNNVKNILIGIILGFVLAAGAFTVAYILDDTVKTTEDVERYLGLHTLASVPEEGGTDNSEKHEKKRRFRGVRKQ